MFALDAAALGALQDTRDLQTVTPDAAACTVRVTRGGLSLTEAVEEVTAVLRTLPGVDMVVVTLFGVRVEPADGWHRLQRRGWLYEWTAPGAPCSCVPRPGQEPLTNPWLSQRGRSDAVAVVDIDLLPPEADTDRRALAGCGVRAMLSTPIVHGGRMFGSVSLYRTTAGRWPEGHVANARLLSSALAAQAATTRASDELAAALVRGDQARDMQQQLFAAVGDRLRTPLAEVLGTAEVLAEEARALVEPAVSTPGKSSPGVQELATTVVEDAEVIAHGGEQVLSIVDDLLRSGEALADPNEGRTQVNVAEAVRDVEHWVRTTALLRQVTLSIDVDPTHEVCSTPSAVRQILTHLVGNAVTYNRVGGHVHICSSAVADEHDQRRVRVSVRDTGPGLTPEQRDEVFQPFVRFAPADTPGTGLGLSLSRSLAERDGGTLELDHVPVGLGSCFWLELPAQPS